MKTLTTNINQENISYEIIFTDNIFLSIKEKIKDFKNKKFLLVVDDNVFNLYKDFILRGVLNLSTDILILKHGERNKNLKSVLKIIDKLIEKSYSRKDFIVSLGGGVTGDIVGFASSLFKRGLGLIQIPTTLLSMFDSSIGGKTGVDYAGLKNGIGTFYNPNLVLIDKNFLKTLKQIEILGGFFEGIKHSIMQGKKDFSDFCKNGELFLDKSSNKNLESIISRNIQFKLKVVKSDPKETNGKRKILNYGHTFGHALETYLNFKLGHGICVGFGIMFSNLLSYNLGFLKEKTYLEINNYNAGKLKNIKLKNLNFDKIYNFMLNDKKNENSNIKFILLKDYGEVFEYEVKKDTIKETFEKFKIENCLLVNKVKNQKL